MPGSSLLFRTYSYEHLLNDEPITCDVLVTGTDKEARLIVLKLIADAGMIGWDAGPLGEFYCSGRSDIHIDRHKQAIRYPIRWHSDHRCSQEWLIRMRRE